MKKFLYAAQVILAVFFFFTLLLTVFQLLGNRNPLSGFNNKKPEYNGIEEYDPGLSRLNTIKKLEKYCDSLLVATCCPVNSAEFEEQYPKIITSVVRKRFYHGYSYYGFNDNYAAFLLSKITLPGYSAVVIPDDIIKFPYAACSQQSILMMELLKDKGFKTRKIGFSGNTSGHFCFEVFYNNEWHFYDTDMEPDASVLEAYNRPGIAFLAKNPDILTRAYRQYPKEKIMDIFLNYFYGPVNKFPAPKALIFHKITKILSYTIWLFFLITFLLVRRRYKRLTNNQYVRNHRIYFPQPESGTSPSYYPGLTAPGA